MSSKLTPTALPAPPNEYDLGYMNRLVKQISLEFTKNKATTPITCGSDLSGEAGFPISGLTIIDPPISLTGSPPEGFPEGSVWCDTTSENSLKIITSGPYTDQDSLNLANTTDPALGDALIGFRQSNASGILTGAVGRTVHEKLQEFVSVKDFGAIGDGVENDTTALNAALAAAVSQRKLLFIPSGTYLLTSNITVPTPSNSQFGFTIVGEGKHNGSVLQFSGAAVTTGLTFSSPIGTYQYWGTISELQFNCVSGAKRGITIDYAHAPEIVNCQFNGATEYGLVISNSNQPVVSGCLFKNNGSSGTAQVWLDYATAFSFRENYIAGSPSAASGLDIDRCPTGIVLNGAIENTGIMIRIGNAVEGTYPCKGITLQSINMENPTNCYVKIGYGWTSTFGMQEITIRDCIGFPSGSTTALIGVDMKHCRNVQVTNSRFGLIGGGTATYNLDGTTNSYIFIGNNQNEYGNNIPWVLQNGSIVNAASPLVDWASAYDVGQTLSASRSGTTAVLDLSPLAAQGGIFNCVTLINAAPTTINRTSVVPSQNGYRLTLIAADANTTIAHLGGGGTGQFRNTSGANLALGLNEAVTYVYNSSSGNWSQT